MNVAVRCPQCGKSARVNPDDPEDTRRLCVACGGAFDAAAEINAGRFTRFDDVAAEPADNSHGIAVRPNAAEAADGSLALAARAAQESRTPPRRGGVVRKPTRARPSLPWLVGGVALLFLAALSAVVLLRPPTQPNGWAVGRPASTRAPEEADPANATQSPPAPPPATGSAEAGPETSPPVTTKPSDPIPSEPPASPSTSPVAPPPVAVATSPTPGLTPPASSQPMAVVPAPVIRAPAPDSSSPPAPPPPMARPRPERVARVNRPPPRETVVPRAYGVDDEAIEASIKRGIDRLAGQFNGRTKRLRDGGMNALAVYALLQAGIAVGDERLNPRGELGAALLDAVRKSDLRGGPQTYSLALRASCLSLFDREADRSQLRRDLQLLLTGHRSGAYGYVVSESSDVPGNRMWASFDNSNTQYGQLGVWAASDAGMEVPTDYWTTVERHWQFNQLSNGQWGYGCTPASGGTPSRDRRDVRVGGRDAEGTLSMTSAGLASLFVARDRILMSRRDDRLGEPPFSPALERGLAWFESGDNAVTLTGRRGYTLYGVERVGLASGFKFFGDHDWFRRLAADTIAAQQPDGGWGDPVEDAYNLLFLSRGRHPILMNKLRFDGAWSNRPCDLAGLTPWISKKIERPLNWQIVNVNSDWRGWLDSPVLYIAGHKPPAFTDAQLDKLRQYALAGGMIFTHADGASPAFEAYVTELAHKLFPQYEYAAVPPSHPLYSMVFKVDWQRAPLRMVSNGSRVLMLHSGKDLSKYWQWRDYVQQPEAFRLPANIHVYAAGKRDLRNRLASPYVPEPGGAPVSGIDVARVQYNGNWDPEPGAWTRFGRLMEFRTGTQVRVRPVRWANLSAWSTPFAHVTGTARYVPTVEEATAMRDFVEDGGMLLVDDCGGGGAFTEGLRNTFAISFAGSPEPVRVEHPLLNPGPPGMADLRQPTLRPFAAELLKAEIPPIEVTYAGRGTLLVSRLDISSGLLGTGTWGIRGYAPKWCESFMQNALLWTLDGQPIVSAATKPAADANAPAAGE